MLFRSPACLLLIFLTAPVSAQARLEWKFAEGDTFFIERETTQKDGITIGGKKHAQENASVWLTRVVVKDKSARSATLVATLENIRAKSEASGETSAPNAKLLEKMKGQQFVLIVTPQGRINRLEGYEAFAKNVADGKADIEKSVRALFSEESLRESFEEVFSCVPDKAVAVGAKWKRSAVETAPPVGTFKTLYEYAYEGEVDEVHQAACAVKMTYQAGGGGDLFRVVKGELKSEEGSGAFSFDAAKGRLRRAERTLKMQGEMTVEALGKQTPVEFRCEHTTRIRVLDKRP